MAGRAGIPLTHDVIIDTDELAADEKIRKVLKDRLANRRWGVAAVLLDPVCLAAAALQNGDLHGCVAGATRPTADVLRLAEQEPRRVALLCRQHSGCLVGRVTLQWLPEHQLRQVVGALVPSLFSPPH